MPKSLSITFAEIEEINKRIADWLSEDNLSLANGKSLAEIVGLFGNRPQVIGYIPKRFLFLMFEEHIPDNRIYCGKGYFIDHAVNHHPNIKPEMYGNILHVLQDPDEIVETESDNHKSFAFIKKIDRYNAVIVQLEHTDGGKIVWHKSFINQKAKPYKRNTSVWSVCFSSEADNLPSLQGDSSISRGGLKCETRRPAPGRSLSARDDKRKSRKIIKTKKKR